MYFQAIGKHYLAGSEFKVVLRKSYKTERQVVQKILIVISLNDFVLSFNCFKNIAASREQLKN